MSIRLITFCAAVSLLSACGFHLRGKIELPPGLDTFYVKGSDGALRAQIEDALVFSGADIVDTAEAADAVLEIVDIAFYRQVASLDSRGLATGYTLKYEVKFKLDETGGKTLLEESTITLSRALSFDSAQILQVENEQEFLREDMEREMAQRILRKLTTIAAVTTPDGVRVAERADRSVTPAG